MVPINAARVAAGADSLNELVEDPRTGETCRRCDTLDAREKASQSAPQRSRPLVDVFITLSRVGMKDYFAKLTSEQRAAHGALNPTPATRQKKSQSAPQRS